MQPSIPPVSTGALRGHIASLQGVRHPLVAPEALEKAANYIESTLQNSGYKIKNHCFLDNGREYRNLIATLPGTVKNQPKLLIIAHYDTVSNSPGADDNASGVALLLELARICALTRLKRTMEFVAVNLEENERETKPKGRGLRGSRALAQHARKERWSLAGVIVLESVAYASEDAVQTIPDGLPIDVPTVGDFIAVIGNKASDYLVEAFLRAAEKHQPDLPKVPLVVPGNGEMIPDTRRSDHAPFWDEGYPAIMLTDTTNFRNPHYHQPSDTLETLNLDFATAVGSAVAGLIIALDQTGSISNAHTITEPDALR
ncbi:peptidase M28 [Syntrophotalea acetylenivorans]|uniref:Peptidase M28 n=1 Tax=Syntrophotalea acetylenivorans TaxID=1842532 RepID=A0A1L3GRV4_9BACT|nr:M28 family peptidase [Syntrophotalea acetylenivorans]APG28662.1 peptidase M28 [Syntrophotalea acetylenivorans]